MKILKFIKKIVGNIKRKMTVFLYDRFTKYIIDYKIEGENLRILTNFGDSRLVHNTEENQAKLNQVIVKNKLEIAKKIDEYEKNGQERLTVLILNIMLLGISGIFVPLTFFTGSYIVFILSIFLFSFLSLAVSVITVDYYVLIEEIKNLKNITGYKKENEFNIPRFNIKSIKNEIK